MSKDGAIDAAAVALGLTPAEAERRKAFIGFRAADAELLGYLVSRYRTEAMGGNRLAPAVRGADDRGKREDG